MQSNNVNNIASKFRNRNATIGIIGLGYVGLPLAIRFCSEDFTVIGFDVDEKKVNILQDGGSYIEHIEKTEIQKIFKKDFKATTNFENIKNVDAIIICVPTPLGVHNEPDLSFIDSTLKNISPFLRDDQVLILESTTYPGTTEEVIIPFVNSIKVDEKLIFEIGQNFYVGYSPEREDPGNQNFTTKTIPKVVSGVTPSCLEIVKILYDQIVDKTVPVSSPKVAEMTKILENIHRAVNIGLVNELKVVSDKLNIDIYEVINAAATKPFGFTPYYPGPGLGGHCIPIDPFYLTWKAKEVGMNTRFIELAGEINTAMPSFVVQKIGEALNSIGKAINGSKVLVLGLAYKKNVDDLRESPSLEIIDNLIELGCKVSFIDPFFESIPRTRKHNINLKAKQLDEKSLSEADIVLLATDHDEFDYKMIKKFSKLIVDTRGRFSQNKNVVKA